MSDILTTVEPLEAPSRKRSNTRRLALIDRLAQASAVSGALCMVSLLLLLLVVVGYGAWPAMQKLGFAFLWHTNWSSTKGDFGALPLIYGTLVTAGIALAISVPVSLGSAIFLTKLAPKLRIPIPNFRPNSDTQLTWISPRHVVTVISFLIELLAAIPSIAYGLWGVFVLVPFMQSTVQPLLADTLGHVPLIGACFVNSGVGSNVLTAGLILSIMVTPIMTAIIRDVISVAPVELEQGALGLGATWWQATRMVLGFSRMGILGAIILGFARAIGETMAVTMVIGNSTSLEDLSITSPGYTISSILANQFNNADTDAEKQALIYGAFVLLVITALINGIARVMVMRTAARAKRR